MKKNVAYLRVSTEAQTEKYGLDMQRKKITEYCEREKIKIDRWYVDGGYSGSRLDRPDMKRLLSDAEKGYVGKVFVYKLDRLSRDTVDTLNLLNKTFPKYGVQLISMTEEIRTENPMDEVMTTMNAAMNQYERKVIRMRMSAGMVERVRKGLWPGGGRVPIGYYYDRNDGILHPHPEQAQLVRDAYRLYIDGYSCDRISKILGFKGEAVVTNVLKRKSNIGYIEYKGETYKGLHEPIVDEKTFYEAQECMRKRSTNSHVSNNNILTGLCWCGVCGARMRYQKWGKYHKIICYSQIGSGKDCMKRDPNCRNKKVLAKKVEEEVEGCFREFIINAGKREEKENRVDTLRKMVQKSNEKIKKFYNLYVENDDNNLLDLIGEEQGKVKKLKEQIEKETLRERKRDFGKLENIRRVADIWDDLTNQEKNKILKECIEKVVVKGDDFEIRFITF